jgi:hypothetical protein
MIDLINAALAYQDALDAIQQLIRDHRKYAEAHYKNPAKTKADVFRLFQELEIISHEKAITVNAEDYKIVIATEFKYFKRHAKRNQAEAFRQAQRRGKLPTVKYLSKMGKLETEFPINQKGSPSDSAPRSILERNHLEGKSPYRAAEAEIARLANAEEELPVQQTNTPDDTAYYQAEAAAHRQISRAASAEFHKRYTPEQTAAAAREAEEEGQQFEEEISEFISEEVQPDMLQDLSSQPVHQFAATSLPDQPLVNRLSPEAQQEIDMAVEKELARQKAIEEFHKTDPLPARQLPAHQQEEPNQ